MANQTYDLTQTGQEVQNIINDANGAKNASAQTTLTTDYVMLKDTSGNYHKIDKSSFTEAIRDTLATLLTNNDKGTTFDLVPAIASGDFGSVTPENLASVLGVTHLSARMKEWRAWANTSVKTDINVNQAVYGTNYVKCYIIAVCSRWDNADNSAATLYFLRTAYSGNNYTLTTLADTPGSSNRYTVTVDTDGHIVATSKAGPLTISCIQFGG